MDKVLRSMKSNFFVDSFHNSYHYDDHNTFFSYFHEHPYERGQPLSFLNSSEKAYLIELVDDFGKNNLDVNWNMVADKLNGYSSKPLIY